jgi:hypothetical protein
MINNFILTISHKLKRQNTNLIILGLKIVFLLTALNAIFYSIAYAFSFKTGTYLIKGDYLADVLKLSLSYPQLRDPIESGDLIFSGFLAPLLAVYYKYTYLGLEGLSINELTHFHLPPLTTASIFFLIDAFKKIGFIPTILLLALSTLVALILAVKSTLNDKIDGYLLIVLILISYPFIFFLQRGNFFSFFSFVFILFAIIELKKERIWLAILLIALAINIRPNLILYVVFLYFWPSRSIIRPIIALVLASIIFLILLFFDNYVYPDYTLGNFLKGLEIYNNLYVSGDRGFGYSSSLLTLIKFTCKLIGLEFVANYAVKLQLAFTMVIFFYTSWVYSKKRIGDTSFLFLITALSMLGTPVFADYHLLLFIIPIFFVLKNQEADYLHLNALQKKINRIIFITCCLMLSPLNYINYEGLYALTLIKTLAAIKVTVFLLRQKIS